MKHDPNQMDMFGAPPVRKPRTRNPHQGDLFDAADVDVQTRAEYRAELVKYEAARKAAGEALGTLL